MKLASWGAVFGVLLLGAGCDSSVGEASIEGPVWTLSSYKNGDGLADVPAEVYADAEFVDGTISGSGGCNSYNAAYGLDGDSIEIGPVAQTMKACLPPADEVEAAFLGQLSLAETWRIEDEMLRLIDGDGVVLLEFEVGASLDLTGTEWLMTGYNNGQGGVVSAVIGTTVTAEFNADGTLDGSGGCNTYSGSFDVDGDALEIGELAATEMGCESPEGIMEQEALYLAALPTASSWEIRDRRLTVRDADGAMVATFEPIEDAAGR